MLGSLLCLLGWLGEMVVDRPSGILLGLAYYTLCSIGFWLSGRSPVLDTNSGSIQFPLAVVILATRWRQFGLLVHLSKAKIHQHSSLPLDVIQEVPSFVSGAQTFTLIAYVGFMSRCMMPCLCTAARASNRDRKYTLIS